MDSCTKIGNDFKLDPLVTSWLRSDDPEDSPEANACFDRWCERIEKGDRLLQMSRTVVVDPILLDTRFACVPERCSPGLGQRGWKCCCADIFVPLTPLERKRLTGLRNELSRYLVEREPRLVRALCGNNGPVADFWLDEDGDALSQPNERCIFSKWDSQGRIRCHLYGFADQLGMEPIDIQPFTCRLFPLMTIQLDRGRVLVTVLNRRNYRGWDTLPPSRFPCLSDPGLPPLVETMADTLDWMFGQGFTRELIRKGRKLGLRG